MENKIERILCLRDMPIDGDDLKNNLFFIRLDENILSPSYLKNSLSFHKELVEIKEPSEQEREREVWWNQHVISVFTLPCEDKYLSSINLIVDACSRSSYNIN